MAWSSLTHRMFSEWRDQRLRGQRLLLLWSGGADSTALLGVARELEEPLGFELAAGHVHHGGASAFRENALRHCREFARERGVNFLEKRSPRELRGEEEMRDFRRKTALAWADENKFDRILVAHHSEDLLETRFFRLLRGTGCQGLGAMKGWAFPWWRPFLAISKREIRDYLEWNRLVFMDDPSNLDPAYRRNWLRHEIFPRLESAMPGSVRNLADSLARVAESLERSDEFEGRAEWRERGISRPWFLTLSAARQRQALALYLWELGVRDFRRNQLDEALKRLDNPQGEHRFNLAGCGWQITAQRILAQPRDFRRDEK